MASVVLFVFCWFSLSFFSSFCCVDEEYLIRLGEKVLSLLLAS